MYDPMHLTTGFLNLLIIISIIWFIVNKYKKLKSTIKRMENNTEKILEILESEKEDV